MPIAGVPRSLLVATFLAVSLATSACAPEDGPPTGEPEAIGRGASVEPTPVPVTEPVAEPAVERLGENSSGVALDQLKEMQKALEFHKLDTGEYPESLEALTESTADWPKGYIDSIPLDPWGMSYIYRLTDEGDAVYELLSAGPDQEEGTNDDVTLMRR